MRALVLSGGGVKGVAHVALLERLGELGLGFDLVVGTSAGSIVGALLCLHGDPEKVKEELFSAIDEFMPNFAQRFKKIWGITTVLEGLVQRSLVPIEDFYPFFRKLFGRKKFSDCSVPLVVTVFNLETMETEEVDEGFLVDATLASSSVPGFFESTWMAGYRVVDGGVLANVPVSIARERGADYVLVSAFEVITPEFEDPVLRIAAVEDSIRERILQDAELKMADEIVLHRIEEDWSDFESYLDVYERSKEAVKNWFPHHLYTE